METEGCTAFRAAVPLRRPTRITDFHHPLDRTYGRVAPRRDRMVGRRAPAPFTIHTFASASERAVVLSFHMHATLFRAESGNVRTVGEGGNEEKMKVVANKKWGFLRETKAAAEKAGIDTATGLHRTGLEEYLKVIFPKVTDWIHNKGIGKSLDGRKISGRPDYRSERLKLIVEFDGVLHYTSPERIRRDISNTEKYKRLGYTVVRIPYFIQLTNDVAKKLFGVPVKEPLFNAKYASLSVGAGSPARLCSAGLERMAKEFSEFPAQYQVNIEALKKCNDDFLTGASLLEAAYKRVCAK